MSTPKQKRQKVSLETKKAIIEASKAKSYAELAEEFSIPKTRIATIVQKKDAIHRAIDSGRQAKRARITKGKHEQMEEALLVWFKQVRNQNVSVSGDLLKEKALAIGEQLGLAGFEASNGWLDNFKDRYSIRFKDFQGEAGAVDVGSLREWQDQVLREALAEFSPEDIFNADETGLFWQLLPNKTMAMKGDKCAGGKKSKERITVLVCANMSGTEGTALP